MSTVVAGANGLVVLVVEDNPGDARMVELYLHEEPGRFEVVKSVRLADALALLQQRHIDVALLDLSLPDSFGLDTLARLRAAHPSLPTVVLTGTNDEQLAIAALRQGAQDYLVKGQGDGELMRRSVRYAIERSRADTALRHSEARFRALFENAGIGVVLSEPDGLIAEANPAFCAMLGRSEGGLKGRNLIDLIHPEERGQVVALRARLLSGLSGSANVTTRYLTADGSIMWGQVAVTAIREADEFRYTVAVVEDVTERKRLEDHMRLATTVFENTGEGLFVTDATHRIILVNPAFTEITGYGAADVLGRSPKALSSGRHGADFYERMRRQLAESGKWQGEIWNRRKSGEMFAEWLNISAVRDGSGAVTNYVAVFSDITSRKQIEEHLSYQANHDPLTRLPNRTLFQERLSRALTRAQRNHAIVALLFVDLDHFKNINDTLGHLAGDLLLQMVAERITACIRQGDTVARLSGDEFTIILEDINDPRDAAVVAHKVLHAMAEPFSLGEHQGRISSSIGVALYPVDGGDQQTLIRVADAAMYRAKRQGRNACQFHSETVNAQAFERLALENALRRAVGNGEMVLYYQPIFDTTSGRVVAVEALLRWQHPDIGLVAPNQFLPLADETGLILSIGDWVLEQACRQTKAWHDLGFPELTVDINLSGRQLRAPDLLEKIAAALEATGLPPTALTLEVPEGSAIDKGGEANEVFARFRALGLGLAIDDFGSGYSSFGFLRRLPASALKIDQAFVRNVAAHGDDAEIATAIIAVAHGLHMAVVAPGIESEEQLDAILGYGCDRVQGFLLARPLTPEGMTALLKEGHGAPALSKRMSQ